MSKVGDRLAERMRFKELDLNKVIQETTSKTEYSFKEVFKVIDCYLTFARKCILNYTNVRLFALGTFTFDKKVAMMYLMRYMVSMKTDDLSGYTHPPIQFIIKNEPHVYIATQEQYRVKYLKQPLKLNPKINTNVTEK